LLAEVVGAKQVAAVVECSPQQLPLLLPVIRLLLVAGVPSMDRVTVLLSARFCQPLAEDVEELPIKHQEMVVLVADRNMAQVAQELELLGRVTTAVVPHMTLLVAEVALVPWVKVDTNIRRGDIHIM